MVLKIDLQDPEIRLMIFRLINNPGEIGGRGSTNSLHAQSVGDPN